MTPIDAPISRPLGAARIALLLSLIAYGFSLVRENYGITFGERDSYRVIVGVFDAIAHGRPFEGFLMYGLGASPGYYGLVSALRALGLVGAPLKIALNLVTPLSAAAAVGATFLIVRAVSGLGTALVAALLLMATPLWWTVGQYAHPMWPAIAAFLVSAAFCYWRDAAPRGLSLAFDGLALASLIVAISMRLDIVLMGPMLLGACFRDGKFSFPLAIRFAVLGVLAIAAVVIGTKLLSPGAVDKNGGVAGQVQALMVWDDPKRFATQFIQANVLIFRGFDLFLLLSLGCGLVAGARRRDWPFLALILPVLLINYLFWAPNPAPARHFLYMAPAIALGSAALLGRSLDPQGGDRRDAAAWVLVLCGALFVLHALVPHPVLLVLAGAPVCAFSLSRIMGDRRTLAIGLSGTVAVLYVAALGLALHQGNSDALFLRNAYDHHRQAYRDCEANLLLAHTPQDRTTLVVADAYPIIASMQALAGRPIEAAPDAEVRWMHVVDGPRRYEFYIQGWDPEAAKAAATLASAKAPVDLVVETPEDLDKVDGWLGAKRAAVIGRTTLTGCLASR